ncbi:MAG: hypothetical protein WC794_05200 [Candidatus Doudnabacteria bacterium]|jgi:hypothetical protein
MKILLVLFLAVCSFSAMGQEVVVKRVSDQADEAVFELRLRPAGRQIIALEMNVFCVGGKVSAIRAGEVAEGANKVLVFGEKTGRLLIFGFGKVPLTSGTIAKITVRGIDISGLSIKEGLAVNSGLEKLALSVGRTEQ